MDWITWIAMAPTPGGSGQQQSPMYYMVLMGLMMAVMYMILIRPQRRRDQERRSMIEKVKTGDRVLFAGGLIGTIANVKEKSFTIRIADKVKIEVSRGAVSHVLDKGEAPPDDPNQP